MAHYALITRVEATAQPWRPCAILVAGGPALAARQARALRMGGGLAFVPSPSRFRIRRASRYEVTLLTAFFRGMGMPSEEMAYQVDIDSGYARRERLLRAFFMGLYLNPEGLRKKYGGFVAPSGGSGSSSPSGGVDMAEPSSGLSPVALEKDEVVDVLSTQPLEGAVHEEEGMEATEDDSPLGSANQEDALLSILNSSEANDGGHGREQSFDLDIL